MNTNISNGVQTPVMSSESAEAPRSVALEPLRPRWCVQRDDNTVVPLVAMDELPDSIVLKGIPITLTVLDALRARMELITGDHPAHGVRYQLDQPINTQTVANEEGDDSGSDGSPASEESESSTQKGFTASDKKGNKSVDKALRTPALTTNDTSIIDTMAKKGTMGKKVYCTYWIQTGNCNYMQEGCKYKHEIPKDEETRRAIGFREFPNWPREELPIQAKPAPALHKPWRRQDGKHSPPGASGPSNRGVASPAAAHGTPIILARGNNQASAGASTLSPATNAQYNTNATAFTAPHQHFPTHSNHTAQQRPFSQTGQSFLGNGAAENYQQGAAQKNTSPPSYNQFASHVMNGGRSGSSSPPKQPPISRPTNLGQSSVGQQLNNTGASTRKVAPDYHILNRASGLSAGSTSASNGNQRQNIARPVYSGFPNNWNPQTNAPTSMDISFIAPSSESNRSGSQAVYTPTYTPVSASTTPNPNNGNAFGSLNGNATSDSRTGTPAYNNGNAFTNNNNVAVKGRGPVQFGRDSPVPSTGSARNPFQGSTPAEGFDAASITSPPIQHRVFFREPGQPEFVTNPPEPKSSQNGKAASGLKKHAKKAHATNGAKSAKGKMSGNGYEVLVDTDDQK
ncbi:MAG: hypothetical protein ASARMPRED_000474 [Alectoria sarmentosa]|nr:MAG: hypothetical protein ASARMPRED_000474 [Alectoria sarmentosa]